MKKIQDIDLRQIIEDETGKDSIKKIKSVPHLILGTKILVLVYTITLNTANTSLKTSLQEKKAIAWTSS